MPESRRHGKRRMLIPAGLACLALVTAAVAYFTLTYLSRDPAEEFLSELRQNPIIRSGEMSIVGLGPAAAEFQACRARVAGVNLWREYRDSRSDDTDYRLSLAYLLILAEEPRYITYASLHPDELAANGEVLVWRFTLNSRDCPLTARYKEAMVEVLEKVPHGAARSYLGKHYLETGNLSKGVDILLEDLVEASPWDYICHSLLLELPTEDKVAALGPYLQEESAKSAYAAVFLADVPEWRDRALQHLARLREHTDQSIRAAATSASRSITTSSQGRHGVTDG
ncbi:MAG: hypothetical protein ACP5HU_06305 [Phycisphaerae bacterium]